MKDFWKRYLKDLSWSIGLCFVFAVILYLSYTTPYPQIISKPNITLDYIDQSGTIWVTVNTDNGTYQGYLYISDNGTQKRLEMK